MSSLENEIKRLSNLKNYKDKSESELRKIAQDSLSFKEFKDLPLFTYDGDIEKIKIQTDADQKLAEEKFKGYLRDYEIESLSDLDILKSLVFNEVFERKIQKEISQNSQMGKGFAEKLTKQLVDIQNQKSQLKQRLGIGIDKEKEDDLSGFQSLLKRIRKYIPEHRNEFTFADSNGKIMLARKMVDLDTLEHPWFAGRWLFNYEILKDVKDRKLTSEDAWRYLCCAGSGGRYIPPSFSKKYCIDYIEYCMKNWAMIISHINKEK